MKNGMEMYRGKYRVVCDFDKVTGEPIKAETWIPCKHGQVYRYSEDKLGYYGTGINKFLLLKKLQQLDIKFTYDDGDSDITILFPEKDLPKVVTLFGLITKGRTIAPTNKTNIKFAM